MYYTLGFYPGEEKPDGRYHSLQVRVDRKGVEVRHRKGYVAAEVTAPGKEQLTAMLQDTLRSPLEAAAIEVMARVDPRPGAVDLTIGINPATFTLEPKGGHWVGALDVVLAQFDAQGKPLEAAKDTVEIDLTRERREALRDNWLTIGKTIKTAPGCETVRVVVQDVMAGALGSVHIPLRKVAGAPGSARPR